MNDLEYSKDGKRLLKCLDKSKSHYYILRTTEVIYDGVFGNSSSLVGESPYTEVEVDGEKVKVHLYERGYYRDMGFSLSNQYNVCFTNSTFSDMDSIPSSWGGNGN